MGTAQCRGSRTGRKIPRRLCLWQSLPPDPIRATRRNSDKQQLQKKLRRERSWRWVTLGELGCGCSNKKKEKQRISHSFPLDLVARLGVMQPAFMLVRPGFCLVCVSGCFWDCLSMYEVTRVCEHLCILYVNVYLCVQLYLAAHYCVLGVCIPICLWECVCFLIQ